MASTLSLRTESTKGTILPGPTFDPTLIVNLAMKPKGESNAKQAESRQL